MQFLKKADPQIENLIKLEEKRQAETLMMIPSENIVSKAARKKTFGVPQTIPFLFYEF